MSAEVWLALLGVFVLGAVPWLEALVVIPGGIVAGLPAVPVVIAATSGNLLTVGLAAYAGQWSMGRWSGWRRRRKAARGEELPPLEDAPRRHPRIERIMARGGLPLLALVGPLGLGTQISALVAVAIGVRATSAFIWIGGGTVLWSGVAAVVTVTGSGFIGISG